MSDYTPVAAEAPATNVPAVQAPAANLPTVRQSLVEAMPDFLKNETSEMGVAEVMQFIRPPFVKIVQGASTPELKAIHPEGTAILVPGNDLLCPLGQMVYATPLLMYVEYILLNPIALKGQEPMIAGRSTDPNSDIAKRAKNENTRSEPILAADGKTQMVIKNIPQFRQYCECLNFFLLIHGDNDPGQPVLVSFSRGEHKTGTRFCTLIGARQKPIFSGIYAFRVGVHKSTQNDWYGFDIENPAAPVSPWITDSALYLQLTETHKMLAAGVKNRTVQADYEAASVADGDVIDAGPGTTTHAAEQAAAGGKQF